MSENTPSPTVERFLLRAQSQLMDRNETATVGEVATALVSTMWLHEAVRKMVIAMARNHTSGPEDPELKEIHDLLLRSFRTSTRGLSELADRLLEERNG